MSEAIILKVSEERWKKAQREEHEYWSRYGPSGDDWNKWWQMKFEDYSFLSVRPSDSLLEVGCGPFGNNAKRIGELKGIKNLHLLDPLMAHFIAEKKAVASLDATLHSGKLEDMNIGEIFDVIVCINVLDHVQDVAKCFERMHAHLATGGTLIVGNDLSNAEDFETCPESWDDVMHPIKVSMESLSVFMSPAYETTFFRMLPREQGRNPRAHYGTMLWAGTKL